MKANRRGESVFTLVEQSDHELIVALCDTNHFAFRRPGAKVDLNGHRARVKTLAEVATGALYALRVGLAEGHAVAESHLVSPLWGVGLLPGYIQTIRTVAGE